MDQFVEQLRQVSPLSDEIVGQLLEEMKEVSFAKGTGLVLVLCGAASINIAGAFFLDRQRNVDI